MSLTFADLLGMMTPLYYATDDRIDEDELLLAEKTSHTPEFVVFHPSRLAEMEANAKSVGRRLVHLRDYNKE